VVYSFFGMTIVQSDSSRQLANLLSSMPMRSLLLQVQQENCLFLHHYLSPHIHSQTPKQRSPVIHWDTFVQECMSAQVEVWITQDGSKRGVMGEYIKWVEKVGNCEYTR
jgi:hypothetical protein